VREIALVVKDVMDELGLASFPKTSGATGLHILAPIRPELAFPHVRRFAKALAEEVERRIGDQAVATTTWRVADRVGEPAASRAGDVKLEQAWASGKRCGESAPVLQGEQETSARKQEQPCEWSYSRRAALPGWYARRWSWTARSSLRSSSASLTG
jgi:hypothetical protein